jgi:hypothetical protein
MLINSVLTGKIIKKILRWFAFLLVIVLTAGLTVFSVLRTPGAQKLAGRVAADYLSKKLGAEVLLDRLRISGLLALQVDGLSLNDHRDQPLVKVGSLEVGIRELSLKNRHIWISYLGLEEAGFFLHRYTSDTSVNLDYLMSHFASSEPDTSTTSGEPWTLYLDEINLESVSFGFTDDRDEHPGDRMDFTDILLTDVSFDARDIVVQGDSILADIRHLTLKEKSGLYLHEFQAKATVSPTGIRTTDLVVKTDRIAATMDLDLLFSDFDQLGYFLDSVIIEARMDESILTLADLACFAPELAVMTDPIMFSGNVRGAVSDFKAEGFRFNFGNYTEFFGDVSMRGLPDIYSTYASLDIRQFNLSMEDVGQFRLPVPGDHLELPGELNAIGMASLTGKYEGVYNDFNADLKLISDAGTLSIKTVLKEDTVAGKTLYSGDISGQSINVGGLTGVTDLGLTDLSIEFEGSSLDPDKMDVLLTGWIENFEFREYSYEKVVLGGEIKGKSYDGRLFILDSLLNFSFLGMVDFNQELPYFNFKCELVNADLYHLNLSHKSEDMHLSLKLEGDFNGLRPDDFKGEIFIDKVAYHEDGQDYILENLDLTRVRKPDQPDTTIFRSDWVDIDMTGTLAIGEFSDKFEALVESFNDLENTTPMLPDSNSSVDFEILIKDFQPLSEIFFPEIRVAEGSKIQGKMDFYRKDLSFGIQSDSVYTYGITSEGINISGRTVGHRLRINAGIDEIILSENEDSTLIGLANFNLMASVGNDSLHYNLNWNNFDALSPNEADIDGYLIYRDLDHIEAKITEATANLLGNNWNIKGNNYVVLDTAYKEVRDLEIFRNEESLLIDGRLSGVPEDTLSLRFREWSLDNFNRLTEGFGLSLDGVINGELGLFMDNNVPNVFAGLRIEDFIFNEVLFGNVNLDTRWIESDEALAIDIDMLTLSKSGETYKVLGLNGLYYPFDKVQNFDFDIVTQNLDISVMEPLLSSFSSHMAGFATGRLSLQGTLAKPTLTGRLKLQRSELKVDYLNVTYSFSDEIRFDENFIHFSNVSVYDPNTNAAILNGGIRHRYFNDFTLDIDIEPDNLMALDLDRYQNEVFYGKAFATGKVSLKGPFSNIAITVDARTEEGTMVTIPINYSVDVSQGDFIYFTEEDTIDLVREQREIQVEGVRLDIALNVTRNADIEISLPGDIGFIKASGDGDLRLGVDPNGYLTLNGAYKIYTGLFLFSLEQLVSRRFEIMEGSSISWTGDINEAEVNIVARYRLRTSLSGLGSSLIDPEAASQKVNVFTDIRMTGSLFNPDLSFGIYFPNMQEQDKQSVYAVLDTNDAGLMNQQALSLLVLNSFSATGSSVGNPVNPAAIMSNTLSSMLSQISNDFSIGINYMPGDRVSSEQLEVALSTQLLNDRLLIDGNIDVSSDNSTSQNSSAIVGDVNIEYKLTKDGRFRVKAFNRSNDLSLLNDYSPYTQGVGIFYRKDFNNVKELFSRKPSKKKPDQTPR